MRRLLAYRMSLVRGDDRRPRPDAVPRPSRHLTWALPLAAVVGVCGLAMASVVPVSADSPSGSSTGTVNITPPPVRSVTVSPPTFTFDTCIDNASTSTGSDLTFPNGQCHTTGANDVTVTNGAAAGHMDVEGANAIPSDSGANWTLCGGTGTACTGTSGNPGQDQFGEANGGGVILTTSLGCDTNFSGGGTTCATVSGQHETEVLFLTGPSTSTDTSLSFSTTWTWTAVP